LLLPPGAAFSNQSWFGWLPILQVTAATDLFVAR
jgi:hypothetical protein